MFPIIALPVEGAEFWLGGARTGNCTVAAVAGQGCPRLEDAGGPRTSVVLALAGRGGWLTAGALCLEELASSGRRGLLGDKPIIERMLKLIFETGVFR